MFNDHENRSQRVSLLYFVLIIKQYKNRFTYGKFNSFISRLRKKVDEFFDMLQLEDI